MYLWCMKRRKTNAGARQLQDYLDDNAAGTAARIAEQCGMAASQLCHLVKSRRLPTIQQAVELQRVTGVQPDAWLTK